jgi:DNA-binding beta-propeller fold protein YncE
MALRLEGYVELPAHRGEGGFDHAAVHPELGRLYVAHTANDALDVIDLDAMCYVESIGGLTGVAGALVDESRDLVLTSNRGEDTVGIFDARKPDALAKVPVGRRPNGLAFDAARRTLLVANVGDPADPASHTLSIVDTDRAAMIASIPVPGRTRWAVYDSAPERFFVNIADPPSIVVVERADATRVAGTIEIPVEGPHGLELDAAGRIYCACDAGRLLVMAPPAYGVIVDLPMAGPPDVIFLDPILRNLYVAIGDPGCVEVFDVERFERVDVVETEPGAHTIALDLNRHRIYAFLPASHRAAVFVDAPLPDATRP